MGERVKIDYNSPAALKEFLDLHEMSMQKRFGQNFLINENARKKIVDALELTQDTSVWEVGPGLGAMTSEILKRGAIVTVFEIDHGFARLLKSIFEEEIKSNRLKIVEGDALKTVKAQLKNEVPERFFGNLPYNVAAQIIGTTIEERVQFKKMVVTVQKEVAQRMSAQEGNGERSSFSVLCQWAYDVRTVCDLAGGNFWPVPNVLSRCVALCPKKPFPNCKDGEFFTKMNRKLFASKRKTVRNNLLSLASSQKIDDALSACSIDASERAENLSVEKLLQLSDFLC